ncbi:hypothetical protein D3C87_2069170 [compost metagenome]
MPSTLTQIKELTPNSARAMANSGTRMIRRISGNRVDGVSDKAPTRSEPLFIIICPTELASTAIRISRIIGATSGLGGSSLQ